MSLVDWTPDSEYELLKTNANIEELNNKAKLTCEWEITTQTKEN